MNTFLTFLQEHFVGLIVAFAAMLMLLLVVNWLAWIFRWGRYKKSHAETGTASGKAGIMYIFADFVVKIINDFRHLLALFLVTIFAVAVGYAIFSSCDVDSLSGNLQAVVSTLGGLVGSIVGYYFGESAARKTKNETQNSEPIVQLGVPTEAIKPVDPPDSIR